jgi:hypothetical protein
MDKNCGNCFFFSLKGISSLAPCGDCKYNKENGWLEDGRVTDRWVTDSEDFWKDPPHAGDSKVRSHEVDCDYPLAPCKCFEITNKKKEELVQAYMTDESYRDDKWPYPEQSLKNKQMTESYMKDALRSKENPLDVQVGGGHYKALEIQPVQYIHANKIPFIEGNIIKYITRWRDKGGKADLEKCKHFIDLLIELEFKDEPSNVR